MNAFEITTVFKRETIYLKLVKFIILCLFPLQFNWFHYITGNITVTLQKIWS